MLFSPMIDGLLLILLITAPCAALQLLIMMTQPKAPSYEQHTWRGRK